MSDDITGNETPEEIQRIIEEVLAIADEIELEDAEFVSAADLPDDVFPEWDAAAELADDTRRGK